MLYMQSVVIIYCFVWIVSLLFNALYAKCPYYVVLYMQCADTMDVFDKKCQPGLVNTAAGTTPVFMVHHTQ